MKRVRLHRATSRGFGRLTNGAIDLTGHDFIVVYGPNEVGKSTLADMLSWVLAGRRLENENGRHYADFRNRSLEKEITIGGQVEGSFDEQSFAISRDFRFRKSNRGVCPARGNHLSEWGPNFRVELERPHRHRQR